MTIQSSEHPLQIAVGDAQHDSPKRYVRKVSEQLKGRELLTAAALAYVDEHGLDALTLRGLATHTGMHHTAVYRHFRNKNEIFAALFAVILGQALSDSEPLPLDPAQRIMTLTTALRSLLRQHPAVASGYLAPSEEIADSEPAQRFLELILAALTDLGLTGRDRLIQYQMLESYVLGSSVYDFGGAPLHLESRRRRHRIVPDAAFEVATRDESSVEALNEEAFQRGLNVMIQACVALGQFPNR